MDYRIGIDVGGTNTDAVLMDSDFHILSKTKSPTTNDVSSGIYSAMKQVIAEAGIPRDAIKYAMLGTTHCTNAVLERKNLNQVLVIRIGAPATLSVKPLIGVPDDLRRCLDSHVYVVRGGNNFDGSEIVELDEEEIKRIATKAKGKVESVAISSPFSPVTSDHEVRAGQIVGDILGENIPITLSHEIGNIGLLERENATILNAALVDVAKTTANGFINALKEEGVNAKVLFGQNDGTQMTVDYAIKFPILTIACGPSNGIRGASYLSGLSDALVVDVGGTSTDIGVLIDSFPRESSIGVEIGGVHTNFRMPDIGSIALGGGTVVRFTDNGDFTIGPDSVGYQLTEKGLVFGGDTLTTTDVIVALGKAKVGNPELVQHLDKHLMEEIYSGIKAMMEEAIDKMKTEFKDVPVILVGGGSILVQDDLKGASTVIHPNHFEVANGIGAAIAQIGGQVERIFNFDEISRDQAIETAKNIAIHEAVNAGADKDTIEVLDIEDIPLSYFGNTSKIRVKAAGKLA